MTLRISGFAMPAPNSEEKMEITIIEDREYKVFFELGDERFFFRTVAFAIQWLNQMDIDDHLKLPESITIYKGWDKDGKPVEQKTVRQRRKDGAWVHYLAGADSQRRRHG